MRNNNFSKLTEEEQTLAWMYMIFNRDKIIEKTEQWTKEAEKRGVTLTEYLESIKPINPFQNDGLSKEDRAMLDGMRNAAYVCGYRGEDVEYAVHQALKRMGRYDLLPPCEQGKRGSMSKKKWVNATAKDIVTISGSIWNDDTRTVANAVNYNAQILKDALNRIAELEKAIKLKVESEN